MGDLSMPARLALLAFGLLGACLGGADAHGYLVSPASRNMVALGRNKYESSAGNGLGIQPFRDPGSPGVCGDPFQDASTNFVAAAHSVQATYSQGQTIDITVDVNVNHGGRFSFSVCNRNSGLDQSCFDQNKLERADGQGLYFYLLTGSWAAMSVVNPQVVTARYKLPAGLSCPGGCVLQWKYKTYNSCIDDCEESVCGFYASKRNDITGQAGPLDTCGGIKAEVFQNCADIAITGSGGTTSGGGGGTPSTPTSTPTGSSGAVRCGSSWARADATCGRACPGKTDTECPKGQKCYADLSTAKCSAAPSGGSTPSTPSSPTGAAVRCGKTWANANGKCGRLCPTKTDAVCPRGEKCYASLSTSPC